MFVERTAIEVEVGAGTVVAGIAGEAVQAVRPSMHNANVERMIQRLVISMPPVYNACPLNSRHLIDGG